MLVFSAVNFFSHTSRPIALTPSRSVMAGLYQPGWVVRAVAGLAAEQFIAGHPQQLALGVEQRVLDRADRQRHDAAGGGPRRRGKLGKNPLMREHVLPDHAAGQALDRGPHARAPKTPVILAPPDHTVFGRYLDEVVVSPAGVAGEDFDACDF